MLVNLQAATMRDKKEIALDNERLLLKIISIQRWVREDELALLSKMSLTMTRRTCERMADKNKNFIYREKKPAGYFVRLKAAGAALIGAKSGKNIKIPAKWRHDCLAIQVITYMQKHISDPLQIAKTENQLSSSFLSKAKKIPDGLVGKIHIEVEWAYKAGHTLINQSKAICHIAKMGRVIIAYPFRDDKKDDNNKIISGCDTDERNHEARQTKAIRNILGKTHAPNIQFLRCYFKNSVAYNHARPYRFELIDLPGGNHQVQEIIAYGLIDGGGYRWVDNNLIYENETVAQLNFYCDDSTETEAAEFQEEQYSSEDIYSDDCYSFEVFMKNAILIGHRESLSVWEVISRHKQKKPRVN